MSKKQELEDQIIDLQDKLVSISCDYQDSLLLAADYRELIDTVPKTIEHHLLPWLTFAMEIRRNDATYDLAKFMKGMLEKLVVGIKKDIERIEQDKYREEL